MAKTSEEKTTGNPNASVEEKAKALEAARLQIEKQFGAGSIIKLGAHVNAAGIEVVPSGSILLDEALGIGGYPRGRIIEIFGPESSGKTTLALHAIAEAQKLGGIAAFVDAEHALDPVYAKNLGVNIDELWVSQPDNGEQALEIAENLVRSGAVDVIVVDSVAALTPQSEIEGEMGDAQMGAQARLMSQALRKLTATIGKSRTILVFINQIRMKIGVFFGNPETTTGGNALKFYSSVRLEVRKTETIEVSKDADAIGNRVRVKVVKNKVAPPFRRIELELMFGKGISAIGSLLDCAVKYDIIKKSGAWYSYNDEKIGQGKDNAREYLEQHTDFAKELETRLRQQIFPGRTAAPESGAAASKKTAGGATAAQSAAPAAPPSGTAAGGGVANNAADAAEAPPSGAAVGGAAAGGIVNGAAAVGGAAARNAAPAAQSGSPGAGGVTNGAAAAGGATVRNTGPAAQSGSAAALAAAARAEEPAEPAPPPRPGPGRPRKVVPPPPVEVSDDALF